MKFSRSIVFSVVVLSLSATRSGAQATPREQLVEVSPGIHINVVDVGKSISKPTIVLIPGWRLTWEIWDEQIRMLSKDYRVISLDPRSQGASTKTTEGNTPESRAGDIREVLNKLNAGPVVLVGWSQGVQDVAAYIAQFGTAGLEGVVLVDAAVSTGADSASASPQTAQQLKMLSLYSHHPREYTEGMMHAIIRKQLPPAVFDRIVAKALKTPTAIGAAMLVDDLYGLDRTAALAKINVPALVVSTTTSSDADQQLRTARLLRGKVVTIADAAHAVFVDQPERFNLALREFLNSID